MAREVSQRISKGQQHAGDQTEPAGGPRDAGGLGLKVYSNISVSSQAMSANRERTVLIAKHACKGREGRNKARLASEWASSESGAKGLFSAITGSQADHSHGWHDTKGKRGVSRSQTRESKINSGRWDLIGAKLSRIVKDRERKRECLLFLRHLIKFIWYYSAIFKF